MTKDTTETTEAAAASSKQNKVHGILVGRHLDDDNDDGGVTVVAEDCVPVCHSAPTAPLLDTAFSLVDAAGLRTVGWYVANERVDDLRPSPMALRIMSTIAETTGTEPVLVVVNAGRLADVMASDGDQYVILNPTEAYGREKLSNHWTRPVSSEFGDEQQDAVRRVCRLDDFGRFPLHDFEDHLAAVGIEQMTERDWLRNEKVNAEFTAAAAVI